MPTRLAQHLANHVRRTISYDVLLPESRSARDKHCDLDHPCDAVERAKLLSDPAEKVESALARTAMSCVDIDIITEPSDRKELVPSEGDLTGEHHEVAGSDECSDRGIRIRDGTEKRLDGIEPSVRSD